jgi:hypothetical protein
MDSVECSEVSVGQTSYIETTVYGSGKISFCWKAEACTRFSFSVDGDSSNSQYGAGNWQEEYNYNIPGLGKHTLKWAFFKDTGSSVDDKFFLDNVRWTSNNPAPSTELQEGLDSTLSVVTDGDADWTKSTSYYRPGGDSDSARSGNMNGDDVASKMEILVEGEGTVTFWWKVSSASGDELQFLVDGQEKYFMDGDTDWNMKTYDVTGAGTHSLLWQYEKDSSGYALEDCGWVDSVQWSGSVPEPASYGTVTYKYDPAGRRIEKNVDGDKTTYVYDGGNVIAEYDDSGSLSKKFIHGARVDEVVCMIDVADSGKVYYYHYDGLGSVVALSNSSGNSVYSY